MFRIQTVSGTDTFQKICIVNKLDTPKSQFRKKLPYLNPHGQKFKTNLSTYSDK